MQQTAMGMDVSPYLAVRRAARFSPNSEEADRLILQAVCDELRRMDGLTAPIGMVDEDELEGRLLPAACYVSMARSVEALRWLRAREAEGSRVVNRPAGVDGCQRAALDGLMRANNIPVPPAEGPDGYWLKRGDAAAQSRGDVVFCPDRAALDAAMADFRRRGIAEAVVSAHVVGDLVKFYGVGRRLFRYFYPSDDGISKFGDEARNGAAHHYVFEEERLRATVQRLAGLVGVAVYGGDAIVRADGSFCIIDFNDWPSFSRCRAEAAHAIAMEIKENSQPY